MPTVLFFVLLGMTAIHFIYEKILLPSIRLHYRNKLFELRDNVRNKLVNNTDMTTIESAMLVEEALNNAINRLHLMTLQNYFKARRRFEQNPSIQNKVKKDIKIFKHCKNKVITDSIDKSANILKTVLFFNSFMLLLYVLPILFLGKIISCAATQGKTFLHVLICYKQAVLLLPDKSMKRLLDSEYDTYAKV